MEYIKWDTGEVDIAKAVALAEETGISSLAARVLCARGISDADSARKFLNTRLSSLCDPMLLKDMDVACERINIALTEGEKIAIYGDYDVDGITATYILYDYLCGLGADCVYYIPERMDEGYGVNINAVEKLCAAGVSLVISVDTGITAVQEVEAARSMGVDFIITDHHECQSVLPDACAVINPHRQDCPSPEKNLAGVGVAFKLICALEECVAEQYIPFVCIGTIADVMPLTGENRVIAAHGLELISKSTHPGLCALIRAAGAEGKAITSDIVGFQIAPRINAAGRMSSASTVMELLTASEPESADKLAQELCDFNSQRRSTELEIFNQAIEKIESGIYSGKDNVLVIDGEGWHHGVLGIVASRICEKYGTPAMLISVDGGVGKGSGRSVKGVNLFEGLTSCSEYLEKFGGHEQAAGITILEDKIPAFRSAINAALEDAVKAYQPSMQVDFAVEPGDLTLEEVSSLALLEPYGTGNPRPIFRLNNMRAASVDEIGGGKHLRMELVRDIKFQGVFFGKNLKDIDFKENQEIDAIFVPEVNEFHGKRVQLIMRDVRKSERSDFSDCYERFLNGEELREDEIESFRVSYDDLGAVWRYIIANKGHLRQSREEICRVINSALKRELTPLKLRTALDILSQIELADCTTGDLLEISARSVSGKADLNKSPIARRLNCADKNSGKDVQ